MFLFIVRDEHLPGGKQPVTDEERKSVLKNAFAEVGWEAPAILAALDRTADLYFDSVSQIRMDSWAKGRVALIGDAAACVSLLAGAGAGLAMAEAYVLAGELQSCGGDHAGAFVRYQERLKSLVEEKQETAASFGSSIAPKSAWYSFPQFCQPVIARAVPGKCFTRT